MEPYQKDSDSRAQQIICWIQINGSSQDQDATVAEAIFLTWSTKKSS